MVIVDICMFSVSVINRIIRAGESGDDEWEVIRTEKYMSM